MLILIFVPVSTKENKELLKQIREEAITFAGERAKRIAKQKIEDTAQNKKIALKEQMKVRFFLSYFKTYSFGMKIGLKSKKCIIFKSWKMKSATKSTA